MNDQTRPRLIYLSEGYTTHDRRFLSAAVDYGWIPYWLRCDAGLRTLDDAPVPTEVVVVDWLGSVENLAEANSQRFVEAFRLAAARIRPVVIHAGPVPTAGFVAVSAGVAPVLVTSWGSDLLVDTQAADVRARAMAALRGASKVLVDCQTVARKAITLGAAVDQLAVVPYGVELQSFAYTPPRLEPGRLRLLSLRSLERPYDISTLLRGFAGAAQGAGDDNATLTIAGSGSQEGDLRELAEVLGISRLVTWRGRVSEIEVAMLLRDHDLHVSTALSDGSSVSLLQAMAVGRPSIVSDLPSNREWVIPGVTGWVFEVGNPDSLAQAIGDAESARADLGMMAERGRAAVEARANWRENGSLIAGLYKEVAR